MTGSHRNSSPPPRDRALAPVLARDGLTVRLVGVGGVGGIVGRYLTIFLASLGCETRLIFIDGDEFEPQNASRMLFGNCGNKAKVLCSELRQYVANTQLTLMAVDQLITPQNIRQLLPEGEEQVILLCVDNHATRKLVSDYCEGSDGRPGLQNICLISGGNDGVGVDSFGQNLRGSFGNCQIYLRRDGQNITDSLTRYHDEIANPADRLPDDRPCTDLIQSVPQLLFANLMTASAICNTFWLHLCDALHYGEVVFDIVDGRMRPLELAVGPACDRHG
jgi:molybdopterin/thiamine biosynthesis adenylyltransferase